MVDFSIFNKILKIYSFVTIDWLVYCHKNAIIKSYKKGDIIVDPNNKDTNIYFIAKGIARTFVIHKNEDKTIFIAGEFDNIMFHESILMKKASPSGLEAITDCTLHIIPYNLLEKYEAKNVTNSTIVNRWLKETMICLVERQNSLLLLDAEERYLQFQANFPDWSQTIPLKYVASYLNMSPECLSRVRNKLTKNKPQLDSNYVTIFRKYKERISV